MKDVILAVITSGIISTLISNLFALYRDNKKKENGEIKAIQFLLLDSIQKEANDHLSQGYIPIKDMQKFKEKYDVYHEIGGNGWATELYEKVNRLPYDIG